MKYELLIFDADGTLFDFAKAEEYAFFKTAENAGRNFSNDEYGIYTSVNKGIWKEMELGKIDQETLKAERFRRFFVELGIDEDAVGFSKEYLYNLSTAGFLYEGAEELLNRLKGRYRMVLLTNGLTSVQETRLGKSPVRPYFEELVISESVGISKPDPRIFEHTFNKIGYEKKDKTLMIGDSLTSDIKGGLNFGVDTCWYNAEMKENEKNIIPKYEVHDYEELLGILGM
ncbi:MAG: YjjG family noncanonical pyrimidine nucleotidase [Peptostreptococcaceae bacterium]|nr:YjjG family noncanonical pyrimidine nucleotidase [Peptostreptococcaceae bacterium]